MSLASRLSHGKDKFGNYTVQRIIEHSRGDDWLELRERIEARETTGLNVKVITTGCMWFNHGLTMGLPWFSHGLAMFNHQTLVMPTTLAGESQQENHHVQSNWVNLVSCLVSRHNRLRRLRRA